MSSHTPVLLEESIEQLAVRSHGTYVDCTVGAGGHSAAILKRLSPKGRLLGIDLDPFALSDAERRLGNPSNLTLHQDNFKSLGRILEKLDIPEIHGCLLDLGVSSLQLDSPERGFSFLKNGPLDMRMDPESQVSAGDILNRYSQEDLARLFREFGEETRAKVLAREIVKQRAQAPLESTQEVADIATRVKGRRPGKLHPATLIFQALRISVNAELEGLESFLSEVIDRLAESGRLVVISFHSLEDRIVKQTFRKAAGICVCFRPVQLCTCPRVERVRLITKRPIRPQDTEVASNPRSRSARLRVVEKI